MSKDNHSPGSPSGQDRSEAGDRILYALRRIIRAADVYSRQLAGEYHITVPQLVCLNTVVQQGPMTPTQIGKAVHLSTSTLVGIIDRLEKKGLIQRERDARDRRLVNISTTAEGRQLAEEAPHAMMAPMYQGIHRLGPEEQQHLVTALEKLVDFLDVDEEEPADSGNPLEVAESARK